MQFKRWIAGFLSAALLCAAVPSALAADQGMTRDAACARLLQAADDYTPGLQKSDLLRGDETGALHEEQPVTRAEALVLLTRAFGAYPTPQGDNARGGYPAANFTDIPAWVTAEAQSVLDAGIVAGASETTFAPDEPVTAAQLELLIDRTYAYLGRNEKDDFYAAVNRDALNASTIKPGRSISGALYDVSDKSLADVSALIREIAAAPQEAGSSNQKIATVYNNAMNWDARNAAGVTPLRPYLEAIRQAKSLDELLAARRVILEDLAVNTLLGFSLTTDLKDSAKYMMYFSTPSPSLSKEIYAAGGAQKDGYLTYLTTLLQLGGLEAAEAKRQAQAFWDYEAALAPQALDPQDQNNVDKIYNLYTLEELQALFPAVDLQAVYAQSGYQPVQQVLVMDPGLLRAYAAQFDEAHLDLLKTMSQITLLASYGGYLSRDFQDASDAFQAALLGTQGVLTDEERAGELVQSLLPDYLGMAYIDRHFSAEAKADVEDMIQDILSVYRERIQALDWMSAATREKALKKLDTLKVKVGYPDVIRDDYQSVEFRTVAQGGSLFDNILGMQKRLLTLRQELQGQPVDKERWVMAPYTVNAYYSATNNEIVFPAGILQAPMYDLQASRVENLGGIGYVIAHEISHAFDNNGAKFDENGNAADWWAPSDYAAFQALCDQAVAFYDGVEFLPGLTCNGALTLSENIADLGAAACLTDIVSRMDRPDYQTLYRKIASVWSSTSPRETRIYLAQLDVHAPDKLRVNRVLQSCDAFYEAFDIQEGDGMYLPPEARVSIW